MKQRLRIARKSLPHLLIIFVLLFVGRFLTDSRALLVKSISCKTQFGPCASQEEEKLEEFLGKNIFTLSGEEIKARFAQDFTIRQVLVEKTFPGRLRVVLEKRKPLVGVRSKNLAQEGVFLVDKDGVLLSFVPESPLPQLLVDGDSFVVGERVDKRLLQALTLLSLTFRAQQAVLGEVKDNFLAVKVGEAQVRYSLERDPKVLVGALQLILTRSRIDGKLPKTVDLRYSNPVLTY